MKKILIVSFYFPPMGDGASLRMWRLCKALQADLKIEVLSIKNPMNFNRIDPSLLLKIKKVKIHRSNMYRLDVLYDFLAKIKINPRIFIPEYCFGWLLSSIKKGKGILNKAKFNYILGVYPNLTSMLLSYILSKSTGTPLIIDLHDLFYDCFEKELPISLHKKFYFNLETKILNHASLISVVTQKIKEILIETHQINQEKIVVIPNNADLSEFKLIKVKKTQDFIISYLGSVNSYHFEGIFLLIKAMNKIKKENKDLNIKFRLVGSLVPNLKKKISELDKYNITETPGFVDKNYCNLLMMNSDVLYLTLSPRHKYIFEMRSTIPSKLYEYLCCGKPVLAYLPGGSAEKFINENKLGFVLTKYDVDILANLIMELFYNKRICDDFSKNALNVAEKYNSKTIYKRFFNMIS